ncbi:MAG: hypothetical protein ACLF0G_08110 [Candidatus Brocadiia bacterium]
MLVRRFLVPCSLAAVVAAGCGAAGEQQPPLRTAPAYESLTPYITLPPAFEGRLLYYNGFERPDGQPEIDRSEARQGGRLDLSAEGLFGRGAVTGEGKVLSLRSDAFSPHRPLTISLWWALEADLEVDQGFGLVHLGAKKGYVAHFCRGKGNWCALQRPAAVLQVYYVPGIKNVNGIYDRDLMAHLDLRRGVWHHTALVFRGGSLIEVYTDGETDWELRVRGRSFRQADGFGQLTLGTRGTPRMVIDEVLVLRQALRPADIRTYVAALRQMRQARYLRPWARRRSRGRATPGN